MSLRTLPAKFRSIFGLEELIALVIATVFAALLACVLLGINYAAALAPRAPIVAAVQEGFAEKSLQDESWLRLNADIGAHQFNDCLVLLMTADDRAPALQRALSPTMAGASVGADGQPVLSSCPPLRALSEGVHAPIKATDYYHRYVHGQVAFAALALQVLNVSQARAVFAALSFLLPAGLFAFALFRLVRKNANGFQATNALIALFGLLFTTNFGTQYFGKSFSHFPADAVLYLYLWAVLLLQPRLKSAWFAALLNAGFGALTMYFEMLTGGLPLGLCLALCVAAAMAIDTGEARPIARGLLAMMSFGAGLVMIYAIKMVATIAVFGPQVFGGASGRLGSWIGGEWPWTIAKKLLSDTEYIAGGGSWVGALLLLVASVALIESVVRLLGKKAPPSAEPYWILAAAACVIPLWWIGMGRHTMVHSWFMVRIAVGYIGAAAYLWAALTREMLAATFDRLSQKLR